MPLSWNEIKTRAVAFSKEWENESSEHAEAKSFWNDFFGVFGISRRRVATFEEPVKKLDHKQGFIDLLWKGTILVEHKSKGKDLDKAYQQARNYFPGLKEIELPKYILVSDFERFKLYNLDDGTSTEFHLNEFVQNVHHFGFIAGYEKRVYKEEDPVNIAAAELMGKLHDQLKDVGYTGHHLERYLVRLLFCLFADDTDIFERGIFWQYIDINTKPDGSDLAMHLSSIFDTLNTPKEKRLKNIDESLAQFPYVNGRLFEEVLRQASFDSKMRSMLLEACALDWGKISPAIFGSMFQAAMNPKERRNLGAHYTSEKNIQKVIKPLFLDELYLDFENAKGNRNRLVELHNKISSLYFLDPACGCGNFLIISYRELRQLEILLLRELNKNGQGWLNIGDIIKVDVDQFYGIEYDEFPAMIAEVAMWLIDHQMNMKVSEEFGQYYVRLPLKKAAQIIHGNALKINWVEIISNEKLSYLLGNPPFKGQTYQNVEQKADMSSVFHDVKGFGVLDYVAAWYLKAARYCQNTKIKCAFVSTSSIVQGEQVGILWSELLNKYGIKIHFAHRTFKWSNEAKGNAIVHVVIIGFANFDSTNKRIYEYENVSSEPHELKVANINPYLVDARDLIVRNRRTPISNVPQMIWGNKPTDGGYFLFDSEAEKDDFLLKEPKAEKWIRPFVSGDDFIQGHFRFCLWLRGISPSELNSLPEVKKRVEGVRNMRLNSIAAATQKKALTPTIFAQISQPEGSYLAIPEVSSERRTYIPIAFMASEIIASNKIQMVPNASLWHFGVLTSAMHMTWVRHVCGRLESRYSYSNTIVYNNYPFPQSVSETNFKRVEEAAQRVLDVRAAHTSSNLSDLYDPLSMPPDLLTAHQFLNKAVDLCYRPQAFTSEMNRIEYLFCLYEQYSTPIFKVEKKLRNKGIG
ncbi:N-6 DNA methylase [Dyadobacter sp. LJ53]|uniref:class I SAM-dependent DNA methyltransferase n=1 Tax=Dyadobacter chenwenxiniae TaxID=2906456 RepID=UPI001F336F0C|nr:DNA methyltransferase [Dyadobacter chenwenxiniae]MCF0049567.1 N-6 DNA methylase [Dyadobacter chenwenxiniae]